MIKNIRILFLFLFSVQAGATSYVGIGTASPASLLTLYTTTNIQGLEIDGTSTATNTVKSLFLANVTAGSYNSITQTGDQGIIYMGTTIGTPKGFFIAPWASATTGLRLDTNGNVGIGTTSTYGALTVANGTDHTLNVRGDPVSFGLPAGLLGPILQGVNSAQTVQEPITLEGSTINLMGGSVGIGTSSPSYALDVTGTIRATNLILTSDRRAKKNISSLDETESLEKLSRLNPVSFEWKNSGEADLGIIAQELAEVYPELVLKDQQGALSIRSTSLIAPLIASVKKLKSDNELLREENGKQKSRLDELEKKFNALAAKIEK